MAGVISVIGVLLLIFSFNGKMRSQNLRRKIHPKQDKKEEISELNNNKSSIPLEEIHMNGKENSDPNFLKISNLPLDSDSDTDSEPTIPYNIIAIIVLIFTKVIAETVMLNFSTIIPPYIMTAFQWSSTDAIRMQSILMGCMGTVLILTSSAFVFLKLGTK